MAIYTANHFNVTQIEKSVGLGGNNFPLDVIVIQTLLNKSIKMYPGKEALAVDGLYGKATATQIGLYQKNVLKMQRSDSRVDPNGKTLGSLVANLDRQYLINQQAANYIHQKNRINIKRYINLYTAQNEKHRNSMYLERLITSINADSTITDLRWVAYMLATVQWECAATWQPIEEYGKGKNYAYGKEIEIKDPTSGETLKNAYFGRGYVQLTWEANYKKLGQELGMGNQLHLYPEKALGHDTAYKILSHGMRNGSFSKGNRLSVYLSGSKTDFVGARRIINGNDKQHQIAKLAEEHLSLLQAATLGRDVNLINPFRFRTYA